ncbi:helix-turn-helix domain-containing protein [Streptomyces graminilatus]|uniref:helix-turn-helix domain-containing protein n=1 Tax=Streptomyces graminilatus TaxID=1464070 RepID=UPI0006E27448|nr:helix-turn-helix transcriptional regulator [Streptomyces graminilatus]
MPYEIEEQEAIGRRIKRQRLNLGMTQADLAAAVGKTQGWVSKVEAGKIELDSAGLINQIAAALHCHPNVLLERPYVGTTGENQWQVAAASIVRELRRYDLTPVFDGEPRSSAELWRDTKRLHRLRDAAANIAILKALPDLFREARALAEVSSGHECEEAFAVYAVCCKFAHTAAHALGHPELIAMACERAAWSAQLSGDPLMPAVADWMRVWDMWATADWQDSIALSDKALRSVQREYDRGDPLALRVWGTLQLRAAVSCARGGNTSEAEDRLGHARAASDRMDAAAGPPIYDRHSLTFSTGNVQIHRVSVALEAGDQTKALDLNRQADPAHLAPLPKSRRGHHHMDLARAWLWDGNRDQALAELEEAERIAPQLVRNHPIARATLRKIVYAERVATREKLRGMSNRFHLDDQAVFP